MSASGRVVGTASCGGVALMTASPCLTAGNSRGAAQPASHRLPKAMKTCAAQQGRLSDRLSELHSRITQGRHQQRVQPVPVGMPVKATGQLSSAQRQQDTTQKITSATTTSQPSSSSGQQKSAPSIWTLVDVLSVKQGPRSIHTEGGGRFIATVKSSIEADVGGATSTTNLKLKRREAIDRASGRPLSVSYEEKDDGSVVQVTSSSTQESNTQSVSWRFGEEDASSQLDKVASNRHPPLLQPRLRSIYEIGQAAKTIASLASTKMPPPVLLEETPSFAAGKSFGGAGKVTIKVVRREAAGDATDSPTRSTRIVITRTNPAIER